MQTYCVVGCGRRNNIFQRRVARINLYASLRVEPVDPLTDYPLDLSASLPYIVIRRGKIGV